MTNDKRQMKDMKTYQLKLFCACLVGCFSTAILTSCSEDEVDKNISVIVDSQTPQNQLDLWLQKNYVERYNIELRYRWEDNQISMDYILVPAKYENSIRMARILKYICFDAFDEVTGGPEFVRSSFPKLVQLVGNPGWNSNNSYTLGSSEGGHKINLWYVNHLGDNLMVYDSNWQLIKNDSVIRDREELNSVYFHTIIHEYAHTFHQRVPYTSEFNQITGTAYLGGSYTSVFSGPDDPSIFQRGFVTAYAAYTANEDFAEVFSTYICSTPEEFQVILDKAGVDGRNKISQKLRIVREYFSSNWGLDIDDVRDAVQRREANLSEQNFDDISL